MSKNQKVYLPRQRTRIGRAGYKGDNVEVYDPETGAPSPDQPAVVTSDPAPAKPKAAPAARRSPLRRRSGSAPRTGIKPLKSTGSK